MNWKRMPEGKEKYAAYLCSREWSVLKEAVKDRSEGICERCTMNQMDHVHHLTYARKYAERLEDLQACCKQCHEFIHGKSDLDPAHARPVVIPWCGRKVKSFYLAGKITKTNWRDEIVSGWSDPGSNFYQLSECSDGIWNDVDDVATVCGIGLRYTGPWWRDLYGGHGSPLGNGGPHAYGQALCDEYALREYGTNQKSVARNVLRSLFRSDMVFAWINSADCYGTIFEIGLAKALNKVVVVAVDEAFKSKASDMWLAFDGCYCVDGTCPINAWDHFWDLVAFEDDSPSLHVGPPETIGPLGDALFDSLKQSDEHDERQILEAAMAVSRLTCRGTVPLEFAISHLKSEATDGTHPQH